MSFNIKEIGKSLERRLKSASFVNCDIRYYSTYAAGTAVYRNISGFNKRHNTIIVGFSFVPRTYNVRFNLSFTMYPYTGTYAVANLIEDYNDEFRSEGSTMDLNGDSVVLSFKDLLAPVYLDDSAAEFIMNKIKEVIFLDPARSFLVRLSNL